MNDESNDDLFENAMESQLFHQIKGGSITNFPSACQLFDKDYNN